MNELDVFARVGLIPARLLGLDGEIGSLRPGSCADLTVLSETACDVELTDCYAGRRTGRLWQAQWVIRGGRIVE